ncbi:MAG: flavodoxin domain-containing protein [Paracoccaceae bacterium]|nr:flavodoxin domain-containing protein [Paracoccaceae bacterium]
MKLLIVYGTTDGQTAKIAKRILQTAHELGHSVALERADGDDPVAPEGFDAAILAASVHAGRYQEPLAAYARAHKTVLNALPTLFLSVSLTAAGNDADEWEGLRDCVRRFSEETGWTPGRTEHVAGAFKFADYGFFTYWAMRWIARNKGEKVAPRQNKEFTDWEALDALIGEWTAVAGAGK